MIDNLYVFVDEWCHTVNVEDNVDKIEKTSSVYPNPVIGESEIIFTNENAFNAEVRILSVTGELISVIKTNGSRVKIDSSQYEKGLYAYQIKVGEKLLTGKFIVN